MRLNFIIILKCTLTWNSISYLTKLFYLFISGVLKLWQLDWVLLSCKNMIELRKCCWDLSCQFCCNFLIRIKLNPLNLTWWLFFMIIWCGGVNCNNYCKSNLSTMGSRYMYIALVLVYFRMPDTRSCPSRSLKGLQRENSILLLPL